ncbi:MAG: nuclear transport factor 2 family protein [Candidatus Moduliflexus flocculans]|nr:nuclear transport factor 2 family protein [Candidatus Moduliflexus flocculans]
MEKIETALRVVLEFNDAFNRHDVAGMMALMTDDCVFENTDPAPGRHCLRGEGGGHALLAGFLPRDRRSAHIEIEEAFGLGNSRCVMRWRYSWVERVGRKRARPRGGYFQSEGRADLRETVLRQGLDGQQCIRTTPTPSKRHGPLPARPRSPRPAARRLHRPRVRDPNLRH